MADKRIQDLAEVTSPQDSDVLCIVRDTNGVKTDHRITKSNLVGTIPTATSELTNDSGFITAGDVPTVPTDVSDLTDTTGLLSAGGGGGARATITMTYNELLGGSLYEVTKHADGVLSEYGKGFRIVSPNNTAFLVKYYKEIPSFFDKNPILRFDYIQNVGGGNYGLVNYLKIGRGAKRFGLAIGGGNNISSIERYDGVDGGNVAVNHDLPVGKLCEIMMKLISGTTPTLELYVDNVLIKTVTDFLPTGNLEAGADPIIGMEMTAFVGQVDLAFGNFELSYDI